MRRSLALAAIAASALRAAPARGEPLDISLRPLGVPSADVACRITTGCAAPGAAEYQAAADARQRFASMALQLGLALDSFILAPANTVGHSGFEFGFEVAYAPQSLDSALFAGRSPYFSGLPGSLVMPAFHVRKALPYSLEVGGRAIYLNQSTEFATQLEAKWALNEGIEYLPDLALRFAVTKFFGVRDLDLGVYSLDAVLGKRFGIGGVLSLTPYLAGRLSWVWAGTGAIQYGNAADPNTAAATAAPFPELSAAGHRFTRAALGLRMIASAVTLSLEGTYTLAQTFTGPAAAQLGPTDYPTFDVPAAFSAAASFGFNF